jgi:hypothetical protein
VGSSGEERDEAALDFQETDGCQIARGVQIYNCGFGEEKRSGPSGGGPS